MQKQSEILKENFFVILPSKAKHIDEILILVTFDQIKDYFVTASNLTYFMKLVA